MASLFETARPTSLDAVAGQPAAVAQVRRVLANGWGGRAWWITGPSGTGKTTLARIIAAEGADDIAVEELDAQRLTPAKVRQCVESYAARSLFGKGGKAFVVNEAHGMRRDTLRELLTAIEPAGGLPSHVVWIFTTTATGEAKLFEDDEAGDAAPLLSRCIQLTLRYTDQTGEAFALLAQAAAKAQGFPELPLSVFAALVTACKGNMRRVYQRVESGAFLADAIPVLEEQYATIRTTKTEAHERRRVALLATIAQCKAG